MADTAAHLTDRVVPEVPIRQWVLTLPYPLRYRCAYDAKLTSAVVRSFIRALFAELRRRSRRAWDIRAEQCGSVTFIQRFGSALNLNVHFHTLALDGAYACTRGQGQAPRFLPLPPPSADEVARVLAGTARRIRRLLEERAGDDDDTLAREEPLLALLSAHNAHDRVLLTSFSIGTMRRIRRLGFGGPTGLAQIEAVQAVFLPRVVSRLLGLGGVRLQIPQRFGPVDLAQASVIERMHRLGLAVDYWVVNDPPTVEMLLSRGADGIVTDDPGAIARVYRNSAATEGWRERHTELCEDP